MTAGPAATSARRIGARPRAGVPGVGGEAIALAALLAVALVARLPTMGQPLLEKHDWRQTQTAYTALLYRDNGVDLLHPKLPVLGEPFEVPFEFPLFQAIAAPVMRILPPDTALRYTGLVIFLFSAVLLWWLVRRLADGLTAWLAAASFVLSPFALVWSRTSMIEQLATALALGLVCAAIAWAEHRTPVSWVIAVVVGSLALMVKITTGIFWSVPALILGWSVRRPLTHGGRLALLGLAIIPLAASLAWTRYADGIKAASPSTAWLTSGALMTYNFGTLEERLDPVHWTFVAGPLVLVAGLPFALLLPSGIRAGLRRDPLVWGAIALATAGPLVTFFHLYRGHDYYYAAIAPGVAAFVALGTTTLSRLPWRPRVALLAVALIATYVSTAWYWLPIYDREADPGQVAPQARELADLSLPGDLVVVTGRQWSPAVLYYARRSGHMLPENLATAEAAARLRSGGYRILSSRDPLTDPLDLFDVWPWIGALGMTTYALGDSASDIRGAPFAATEDADAYTRSRASETPLLDGPTRLRCTGDGALQIKLPPRGVWIEIDGAAPATARIRVAGPMGVLPVRPYIHVAPAASERPDTARITCAGTDAIVVRSVFAGT